MYIYIYCFHLSIIKYMFDVLCLCTSPYLSPRHSPGSQRSPAHAADSPGLQGEPKIWKDLVQCISLVGGLNPSEKYESVGTVGMIILNVWKN